MIDSSGPFVHIATFCRDVIEQVDGAVTLVGVTTVVELEVDEEHPDRVADLMLYIAVRGGDLLGKHEIEIRPIAPDGGAAFAPVLLPVLFEGGVSGAEIQVRVAFAAREEGNYWFDVLLDGDRLLTRIPLRIQFGPAATGSVAPSSTV